MIERDALITQITDLGEDYFSIEASCPDMTPLARPGHFLNVLIKDQTDVLLRRPLAFFDVDGELIKLFIKRVGRGTGWLSQRKSGDVLSLVGPLGKGLFEERGARRIIMVAGGVGLAPLYYFLTTHRNTSFQKVMFYGARSGDKIFYQNELRSLTDECYFVTDDGTLGAQGRVTEELERYFEQCGVSDDDLIMACGPNFMLKAVVAIADRYDVACQLSLESYMGCGAGVCLSCVLPARNYEHDGERFFKLCTEGPVIDSKRIDPIFFEESYATHY